MPHTHPKILIVRFSSIGDIVLTTPVIRAIKKQVPGVEVHFLTKKQFAPILSSNPYIDKLFVLKPSLSQTVDELRNEKYNRVIDLHNNQRTFLMKTMLRVKTNAFPKLSYEKWLMVNFKINKLPNVHIVDRYMEAAMPLGIVNDGDGLDFFIDPKDEVDIQSLPPVFAQQPFAAFAIGAQHFTKRFPVHKIIEVCKLSNMPILLLGGKDDIERGEQIVAAVGGHKVYNACGQYSLASSASLVRQAAKVVTNDTGLMHIAAAFHKPIISIWGNTIPEFGMYPYYGDNDNVTQAHIVEAGELDCRPCSKLGHDKCPRGHFRCMELIEANTVARLLNEPVEAVQAT